MASLQQQVKQAYMNNGLTENQANIITAEVGRENSFDPKALFGMHTDPKNNATNIGMLSWQGDRAKNIYASLKAKGLIDSNSKIKQSQEALNEMAKFSLNEIRTNPAYKQTKEVFLNNPNVDYNTANKVLGTNYIRWRYNDPEFASGHKNRDQFYEQVSGFKMPKSRYNQGSSNQPTESTFSRVKRQFDQQQASSIASVYQNYTQGKLTPQQAKDFEEDVKTGAIMLPRGASLKGNQRTSQPVQLSQKIADSIGSMNAQQRADLQADIDAGIVKLPTPTNQQSSLPDFNDQGQIIQEPTSVTQLPEPIQQRTALDQLKGVGETALSLGTGITGGTVGLIGGSARGLANEILAGAFGSPEAARRVEESAQAGMEALTYAPRTETGQEYTQAVGEALAPTVAFTPAAAEIGMIGQAARGAAPIGRVVASDIAQAAKPVISQAVEAVKTPVQATTNAIKSGAGRVAEAVGLREPQQPVNTGANVGAAQVDQATLRQALAQDLPNKPELTLGQLTRNEDQLSFEQNTARTPLGGDLRQRYAEQHAAINNNLDIWLDEIGPSNVDRVAIGEGVDKALKTQMAADKKRVKDAYDKASASPEAQSIVDLNLKMKQDNDGNVAPVAPAVDDNLASLPPETRNTRPDGEIKTLQNGLGILHGTGDDALTINDINIVRQTGQKQGKAGRVYGGFYGASKDRLAEAEGYANAQGGNPTVYEVRIKPQTKVLEKKGDVTRLSENYINDLKKDGIGLVVGKDPRGRTEYVVVDKDAIATLDKYDPNAPPSTDGLSVIDYLNSQPELPTAPIISAAKKTAEALGIARREADGTLTPLNPTVKQMEAWRQQINANTNMEAPNIRQAAILKNYIDSHIEPATGNAYKAARDQRRNFAKKWESNKIITDLIGTKKGTDDRIVALENIQNKIVNSGSLADLRQVKRTLLGSGSDDGKQAWKDIQAATLQDIKDKANSSIATNANGETVISPSALNKAINNLDQTGKLDYMFGKDGANKLRSLNEVSKVLFTVPPETMVNRSGSGLIMAAIADMLLGTFSGLPAPVATAMKLATTHIKDSKIKARVRKALNISERGNF